MKNSMISTGLALLASQLHGRHEIPKSTVVHPQGVIVPGDPFMTEKLEDPDYVPYCMIKPACMRVRRVADGFECPSCRNKMNYDLTHFNGNVNVRYSKPKVSAPSYLLSTLDWNKEVDKRKLTKKEMRKMK